MKIEPGLFVFSGVMKWSFWSVLRCRLDISNLCGPSDTLRWVYRNAERQFSSCNCDQDCSVDIVSNFSITAAISLSAKIWQSEYNFANKVGHVLARDEGSAQILEIRGGRYVSFPSFRSAAIFVRNRLPKHFPSTDKFDRRQCNDCRHEIHKNDSDPQVARESTAKASSRRFSPLQTLHASKTFPGT